MKLNASLIQGKIRSRFIDLFPGMATTMDMRNIGGGCINECFRVVADDKKFFCKVNSGTSFPHLFEKEARGLQLIADGGIRTPAVIDRFDDDGLQFLILEWIDEGERTGSFWKEFGWKLAQLHQVRSSFFGLEEDNYMGSVLQSNRFEANWNDFFIIHRLDPLVKKCVEAKLLQATHLRSFESIYQKMDQFFDADDVPSLLHGDLWSGNFMCDENENPVLIDPAVYYGNRMMDIGMTRLFGGFHSGFYESYHHHYPLPSNHEEQVMICNLYPLLIHVLLFGKSYLPQIESILGEYG